MADYHEIGVGMQARLRSARGFAGCERGAGANSPTPAYNSRTSKLLSALPK
jgi:hypothetical protein